MPFEWPPRTCCSCRARCPPASVSQQGSCCPWTVPSPPEPRRSIVKRGRYLRFSILQQIHETRLVGNDSQALVEGLDGLHVLVLSHQQQEIVKYETNFSLGSSVIAQGEIERGRLGDTLDEVFVETDALQAILFSLFKFVEQKVSLSTIGIENVIGSIKLDGLGRRNGCCVATIEILWCST